MTYGKPVGNANDGANDGGLFYGELSPASDELARKVLAIQAEFKAKGKPVSYEQAHNVMLSRAEQAKAEVIRNRWR